jgi:pimeloyl-ACP methyl ester carboxylesterase
MRNTMFAVLLLFAALAFSACSHDELVRMTVKAPNQGVKIDPALDPGGPGLKSLGVNQQFRVPAGPPAASLAIWVIEPRNLSVPRGTILVLHGFLADRGLMLGDARCLSDAGYRTVLVDLRGQGRSTGDYMTFGVVEARDVVQIIDELQRRKLIAGNVGIYGMSYGAATAIEAAGIDPRIKAVVALAPFATMRQEVPHFGRQMLPALTWYLSDRDFVTVVNDAGKLANFDPDDASPLAAIQRTHAPVLLAHGTLDLIIPVEQSKELHAAAADHSELLLVPGAGHLTLWIDADGSTKKKACEWFDRYLNPVTPHASGPVNTNPLLSDAKPS